MQINFHSLFDHIYQECWLFWPWLYKYVYSNRFHGNNSWDVVHCMGYIYIYIYYISIFDDTREYIKILETSPSNWKIIIICSAAGISYST